MLKIIAPERETDNFGSGAYLASRGKKLHKGIDIACYHKSLILPIKTGICTKLGYPYDPNDEKKGFLRYIQITDNDGIDARYFYVKPFVELNKVVDVNHTIGACQDLQKVYPGITNHIHFEVKKDGEFLDPVKYLLEAMEAQDKWIV